MSNRDLGKLKKNRADAVNQRESDERIRDERELARESENEERARVNAHCFSADENGFISGAADRARNKPHRVTPADHGARSVTATSHSLRQTTPTVALFLSFSPTSLSLLPPVSRRSVAAPGRDDLTPGCPTLECRRLRDIFKNNIGPVRASRTPAWPVRRGEAPRNHAPFEYIRSALVFPTREHFSDKSVVSSRRLASFLHLSPLIRPNASFNTR